MSIALAIPGRNDGQAGASEVIALARAALGGEATLEAVRSLSASGTFRRRPLPFSGGPISCELDLDLLLPHSLSRAINGVLVEEWAIDGWRVAFTSHHEGFASP